MWLLGQLLAGALALGPSVDSDTFEFVTFTPPPGWPMSPFDGGRRYTRSDPDGVGLVQFLASRQASGPAAAEFAEMWRAQAEPIAGPAPQPAVDSEGEVTVALGTSEVAAQGATMRVVVVTVLWRGRVLGVVGMATGPRRQSELQAFFATLRATPSAPSAAPAPAPAPSAPGTVGALGFDVPPGYVQQRNGDVIVLAPADAGERTPCVYGIAPPVASTGNLEADAEAALVQVVVPGWRRLDGNRYAMRGVAAAGWSYAWFRAAFQGEIGGQPQAVNAMAMVLPAGAGRVHVVWGMGSISRCLLDDVPFEQLFHGLRPSGWTSDEGRALAGALAGSWRHTGDAGLQQLHFRADGRFERDLGTRARVGVTERTSATATAGTFTLRDGALVLAPEHRPQRPDRYRVRLYDEWVSGGWRRAIVLLDETTDPPLIVPYDRVDDPR